MNYFLIYISNKEEQRSIHFYTNLFFFSAAVIFETRLLSQNRDWIWNFNEVFHYFIVSDFFHYFIASDFFSFSCYVFLIFPVSFLIVPSASDDNFVFSIPLKKSERFHIHFIFWSVNRIVIFSSSVQILLLELFLLPPFQKCYLYSHYPEWLCDLWLNIMWTFILEPMHLLCRRSVTGYFRWPKVS